MFSKVLLPVIVILRKQGLQVFHYLDYILLVAWNSQILLNHREILVQTLQKFGPQPEIAVPRSNPGHQQEYNGTSSREGISSHFQVGVGVTVILPRSISMPQASGDTMHHDPDGPVGSLLDESFPDSLPQAMDVLFIKG